MDKEFSVIHLPTTVGGNSTGLSNALKKLKVKSFTCTYEQNYIQYKTDMVLFNSKDSYILREIKKIKLLINVIKKMDIIHFNSGATIASSNAYPILNLIKTNPKKYFLKFIGAFYSNIFELIELILLKIFKKPMFITFQGDDARQGDYISANFKVSIASQVDVFYYNSKSDVFKRNKINRISKFASKIYALNPDLLYVLPKNAEFLPYCHINIDDWKPKYPYPINRPLKILHAPTNRSVKGTNLIIDTLDRLENEGFKFELILVEGVDYESAKKLYMDADILIDQLYAGWYGGLAVELMALGKPVVSFIRKKDLKYIPKKMKNDLPIIDITPFDIYDVMKSVLSMSPTEIKDLGIISRKYVEKWHNSIDIAKRLKQDYEEALSKIFERK